MAHAVHTLRSARIPVARFADKSPIEDTAAEQPPPARTTDVWELVEQAQKGDQDAFGELYQRYVDTVFRYALFRVGDRELAEDVTSETFLRALRRIGSVTYQGRDVGAWFVTIARNIVLDHVKSSRHRREVSTAEITEAGSVPFFAEPHADLGPESRMLASATREQLLRAVSELGAEQRECVVLRFLQGLSVAETAQIMDRKEGAVKALQHRAVRRLAKNLPKGLR